MEPMLIFDRVQAGYGKTNILNELSFKVMPGETLGVIGPNGCGKTTMLNALTGLIRISSGSIRLGGKEISHLSVEKRCRMGLGRTFQIPRPFLRMNVYENVLAAAVFAGHLKEREAAEPTMEVLHFTKLYDQLERQTGEMSLLDLKRLEIARAIVARPQLLLLDEVAAGLTNSEVEELIGMIATLKSSGFTIIWIEHVLDTMLHATDTLMCMAGGRCAVIGIPGDVIASPEVERLYLGRSRKENNEC